MWCQKKLMWKSLKNKFYKKTLMKKPMRQSFRKAL
jgi:hypothetical protein